MKHTYKDGGQVGSRDLTDKQKAAGNYEKGHRVLHGMRVSIENDAGTMRRGKDEAGKEWEQQLRQPYGYIRGTTGKDKDHLDVFLGPEAESPDHQVHVIDQDKKNGDFDEHKVMLGFPSADDAVLAYHENYEPGWGGYRAVTSMPLGDFKQWAYAGKSGKRKPASEYVKFKQDQQVAKFAGGGLVKIAKAVGDKLSKVGMFDSAISGVPASAEHTAALPDVLKTIRQQLGLDDKVDLISTGTQYPVKQARDRAAWGFLDDQADRTYDYANRNPKKGQGAVRLLVGDAERRTALPEVGLNKTGAAAMWTDIPYLGYGEWDKEKNALPLKAAINRFRAHEINQRAEDGVNWTRRNPNYNVPDSTGYFEFPSFVDGKTSAAGRVEARQGLADWYREVSPRGFAKTEAGQRQIVRSATDHNDMFSEGLKRGLIEPQRQLYIPQLRSVIEAGAIEPIGFAEGGSTTDSGAYVGYRGRRREQNNDRRGAQEMPLQALRGAVAGTLGFGGDMEGLGRTLHNLPAVTPVGALMRQLTGKLDDTPALPTSDFYKDVMPLKPTSAAGRAAEGLGTAAGVPLSSVVGPAVRAGVRGAKAVAPVASDLVRSLGPQVQALLESAPGVDAARAYAVKPKGGNWVGRGQDLVSYDLGRRSENTEVANWLEKRVGSYIKNDMGTAQDPLLALEKEGKLHLSPDDLAERVRNEDPWFPDVPADPAFHKQATGRDTVTPWENLSDKPISKISKKDWVEHGGTEPWLSKMPDEADLYQLNPLSRKFDNLGFEHVRDYLDQAVGAGNARRTYGGLEGLNTSMAAHPNEVIRNAMRGNAELISRDLDIDREKLDRMSLPDVIRKTSDWNDMVVKAKQLEDMNKGIKSVLKQYPTGHQWVELAPEGLEAEGKAMRHCVGGYCSQVADGNKRILSLRDAKGQPTTTVEIQNPNFLDAMNGLSREDMKRFDDVLQPRLAGITDRAGMSGIGAQTYEEVFGKKMPSIIRQIKGPANRAPSADVLPHVQDLVNTMGPWSDDIGDLRNTGLRNSRDVFNGNEVEFLKQQGREPSGYLTQPEIDELQGLFQSAGQRPRNTPAGYATGGSVLGGIGTNFFPQAQLQAQQPRPLQPMPQPGQPTLQPTQAQLPAANWTSDPILGSGIDPRGSAAAAAAMPTSTLFQGGVQLNGQLPEARRENRVGQGGAPIYDLNTQYGNTALNNTLAAGGAGYIDQGYRAFTGHEYEPLRAPGGSGTSAGGGVNETELADPDLLLELGRRSGYDMSAFEPAIMNQGQVNSYGNGDAQYTTEGRTPEQERARIDSIRGLMAGLDQHTKDYSFVAGMSSGWDGANKGPRSAAGTLYKTIDGVMYPVSDPRGYMAPEQKGGWLRNEGAETLAALSVMLPAFGGWAGMLGQGAAGTLSAGAGLGATTGLSGAIGTTAANALVNAGMAGLTSGSVQGALGSLVGSAGGAAGGALGQSLGGYGQVGQQLGSQAARYLYGQQKA